MNHVLVADASVAIKWVLPEVWSLQAQALLEQALHAHQRIVAPPHLFSEATNALHQRVHSREAQHRITAPEAAEALVQFLTFPIEPIFSLSLYQHALRFAEVHGLRSIYDTLYVVLAEQVDAEMWTADKNLVNALTTSAPWVRFIGDFSPS